MAAIVLIGCEDGPAPETIALDAAAERMSMAPDSLELDGPAELEPSQCTVYSAWSPEILDGGVTPVAIDDGKVIAVGASDAQLALVAQRCFLDPSVVPTPQAGVDLVMAFSTSIPPGSFAYTSADEFGTGWAPPTLEETSDGFIVSFLANASETGRNFRATATIGKSGDGALANVAIDTV